MRKSLVVVSLLLGAVCRGGVVEDERIFKRGDANGDGMVNNADIVKITNYLYNGGAAPPCMNQADVNDDGAVDVSDPIYLSSWLYGGGPAPASPGPFNSTCTTDAAPRPGCQTSICP